MESRRFLAVAKIYLIVFMLVAWVLQTIAAVSSGGFSLNGLNLTSQRI